MQDDCKHEDVKVTGVEINTHLCVSCGKELFGNEVEIFNEYYYVGGWCGNEKCNRYRLLVI